MPTGLKIDHDVNLNGSMATYTRQVVVFSGKDDWTSRIEEDGQSTAWGDFVRKLKGFTTRGGQYADPYNNIVITAGSFKAEHATGATALIFPDGLLLRDIPSDEPNDSAIRTFIEEYLAGKQSEQQNTLDAQALTTPTILICGHGGRDQRCGILGPLLKSEFEQNLTRLLLPLSTTASPAPDQSNAGSDSASLPQVGLISHIGGHKFAGNIIVYFPPEYTLANAEPHPLAGKGIWYGRVEPKHVQGIILETVVKGKVIKDLFRGGVGLGGEILRLPLELKPRNRSQ